MPEQIRRIDWNDEYAVILTMMSSALLGTGCSKMEARMSVTQYNLSLARYFKEVAKTSSSVLAYVKARIDATPTNRNPIPLTLEMEVSALLTALHEIGQTLVGFGYSHDERQRVLQMLHHLFKNWLKADDDVMQSVRSAILPEDD